MMAIIGKDTPWSRLFDMTYAPQYRLLTVEFLSTFVFRPQAPDFQPEPGHPQPAEISFRLCGGSYALSLREFAIVTGLYTEAETDMPIYMTAIHTVDDAVDSAWWPQIGDDPFVRSARVTRIRDPLIRYLHRCIASSITGREREDLRRVYVKCIARFNELIDIDPADMEAVYPVRFDSRTVHGMRIVQKFPRLGLRFTLERGVIWQPGPNDLHYRDDDPMPQQQPPQHPPPHVEWELHQDVPHQHPEHVYRAVWLPVRVEAMLQGIADATQQLIQQQAQIQRAADSTSGSVGGSDLVAGAYRAEPC
ncbi:hypothetical protein E3N88_44380 [Mikania micrantha]|uniref:Uncharacterized protein n=1 Tax=Mikania micrantha TaxID=192012 RepID=A0A5N6LCG7_9ASTR|nr:hypothetical protein E3N88_44380 [Mikania micrantha]